VHDIRVFLGLANFYRRFIRDFSKLATPMTSLLKKGRKFYWDDRAQSAFDQLRTAFTTAPILRHFDPTLPTVLEADASDYALGAVISQRNPENGVLHPVAFHSRKFQPPEQNYEIYDKEMLAIVETLETYRHYFEGLGHPVTVYSDHKNLLWFTETKVYTRRQARWAEKLSRYDFVIVFRPGKQGGKPDALSRRPDYTLGDDCSARTLTFLKPHQVDTSMLGTESQLPTFSLNLAAAEAIGTDDELAESIRAKLEGDEFISGYLPYLRDPTVERSEEVAEFLEKYVLTPDGLVLKDGLVYVPDVEEIRVKILQGCHDARTAGHLGQKNTLEHVSRDYYWPRMRQFVNDYVNTCETCARNKVPRHRPHGLLHPLPIPTDAWKSVSMDLIVELPPSSGHDAIFVCVDRFTKMAHFIPTTSNVTAEQAAHLYLRNVFRLHGLPANIVSDRGQQFTSRFTRRLLDLCDIKGNRSTAYHPQSDGQTERTNQTLEQYLRIYCDYQQDDWHELLPYAEFVYNNTQNASTQLSPFFANQGYHPRYLVPVTAPTESINPTAEALVEQFRQLHKVLRDNLQHAQQLYKEYHDRHAKTPPQFKIGDQVWLNRRNIRTNRPSQKLDVKRMGPFRIEEIVGESKLAYRLQLPPQMRIHPVFHVSLLEPYKESRFAGRTQARPPPMEVEGELEYEVKEVVDSKVVRGKLQYHVEWVGYGPEERTWEPVEHVGHAAEAIAEYHQRYPNRPSPRDLPQPPPRRSQRRTSTDAA
jgi:hypothetical protein